MKHEGYGQRPVRWSNIELLRIIAMFMILVVHFDGAALGLPEPEDALRSENLAKTVIEALSIIGVNLFVLISGYFGIRTDRRRIIKYLGMCAFYSIGIFVLVCIVNPAKFTASAIADSLLFISHNDLWFVRDYFFLMLLAPLINSAFSVISHSRLIGILLAMLLISCYFGWVWGGAVNPTGYNLIQMLTIYILGHWLRYNSISAMYGWSIYAIATAGIIVSARFLPSNMAYAYNSPFVIAAAVGLFTVVASYKFTNRLVNTMASGVFAVYLIHKNPYIWGGFLKPTVIKMHAMMNSVEFAVAITVFTIAVFLVCIAIDAVRRLVLKNIATSKHP